MKTSLFAPMKSNTIHSHPSMPLDSFSGGNLEGCFI
jgi:hypothetical protein